MTAELELVRLRKSFSTAAIPAVADVQLDVSAGECVALLGPSGSGKTTVLRLVAGLERPDSGDVRLAGRSLAGVAPERRSMSMVFQRPALLPHLDVRDNVALAARIRGETRRDAHRCAHDMLRMVGLDAFSGRAVSSLSGGQAQRVALARGLAAEPQVLLLDEPFSALDPNLSRGMQQLVLEVRTVLAPTILLVTHDPVEAAMLADRVVLMSGGQVLQVGTPEALYLRPASLAVHEFLGGTMAIRGTLAAGSHQSPLGSLSLPPDAAAEYGEGLLLLRKEMLTLVDLDASSWDVVGKVVERASSGPRATITVAIGPVHLHVDVPATDATRPGDTVGIVIPMGARRVLPAGSRRPQPQTL